MASDSAMLYQDLNPHQGLPLLVPKTEPKLEPVDEPLPHPPPSPGVLSDYNRLSELFLSTFGQDCQGCGETPPIPCSDHNSRAIVTVPNPQRSSIALTPRLARKYPTRSSQLVRVTDLSSADRRYFRDLIRKTRMLYDSLRVLEVAAAERRRDVPGRRTRADLKAAALMREHGLWLNRDQRIVGDIPGVEIGDVFLFRMELCVVGLHGQSQAGIDYVPPSQSPNGEPVATSIIVSGGYEDDEDAGDVIVYTGHGGQDKYGRQVMHQQLEYGNLALERSMTYGVEVRVIRGFKYGNSVSGKIYVYDGLYRVTETWFDVGKSGFGVFKFKLVRVENQVEMGSTILKSVANFKTQALVAQPQPKGYITLDLSRKKEVYPVFFYNDVDGDFDPVNYDYIVNTVFPPFVYSFGAMFGCNCVGGCLDDCSCATRNGGQFAYDQNGTLVRGKPLIFECGPTCSCPPSCRNRVTQKGIMNRFEVFRSHETGWGVRSLDLIQVGSFICEYAGVLLTRQQAQICSMNGDNLIYPGLLAERWKEWGNLSEICSDYSVPHFPLVPPLDFALDVSRMRNIACYMSHSSSPNVMAQLVLYDHNSVSFPHLMLFAMESIPPMRELSLDYGVVDDRMGKPAICN